jgi:hypothetical protein
MPFQSKAQQRFMFAAEDRGDLPKGTASRWAHHTPNIKSLPEKTKHAELLELAFRFGAQQALEEGGVAGSMVKEGFLESALGGMVRGTAHLWAPGALGYYMAGPENGPMGALAGMAAGAAGRPIARSLLRNSKFLPDELALVKQMGNLKLDKLDLPGLQKAMGKHPDMASKITNPEEFLNKIKTTEQQMPAADWAGRLGGAAGAGYLMSRAGPRGRGGTPPGYYPDSAAYGPSSYGAPAVSDMSSHYMGLTPNG